MIFYTCTLGDVEDPEIYAASPIFEWQKTEMGQWIMARCADTAFRISADSQSWGYKVDIYGTLSDEDSTYFTLKYK